MGAFLKQNVFLFLHNTNKYWFSRSLGVRLIIQPFLLVKIPNFVRSPLIITYLKNNISSWFSSSGDVLSAFSIFDPRKVPSIGSEVFSSYVKYSIHTLLGHYGVERSVLTLLDEETVKEPIISQDVTTEWKTFLQYMAKQPKNNMHSQLKE